MVSASGLTARYRTLKERLKKLYEVYGIAAVITWFSLFFLVLAGFVIAFEYGNGPGTNKAGWVAAYVATEATKPIRILITLALTPMVVKFGKRMRGAKDAPVAEAVSTVSPPAEP
jgi:hypothetical protein